MQPHPAKRLQLFLILHLVVCVALMGLSGCRGVFQRNSWREPHFARTKPRWLSRRFGPADDDLAKAEFYYQEARASEPRREVECVDYYYQAATFAWSVLESNYAGGQPVCPRAMAVYHSSLSKLLSTGQDFDRLDPAVGLEVCTAEGWLRIPIMHQGFAWRPEDFDGLVPVGRYQTRDLKTLYCCCGLGVAAVGMHCRRPGETFRKNEQAFPVTAVLRPSAATPEGSAPQSFVLELFNTQRLTQFQSATWSAPLTRDLSAPFVYRLKDQKSSYVQAFFQPGASSEYSGLFMIAPYESGKIPLVFVHGLLSDPMTWANVANEILARPDLESRYQIWGFEYATGEPFLDSASLLRRQLKQVRAQFDPLGNAPVFERMVLIGHSMGGLVAKLQVAYSGDVLWRSVSECPLESIRTAPATRMRLAEAFFFDPSPTVSRVIFVGTPHQGSPWAERSLASLGSSLVEEPGEQQAQHAQLIRDNPGVFSCEFTKRVPTSIDLLRPDSPLLQATNSLSLSPRVTLHSLIGSYRPMIGVGPSDTIVPVASARLPGVASEKVVRAKHADIHKSQAGIEELLRILRLHLCENQP